VLALIIFNLLPILLLIIHLHICPLSCLERQRGSWAGSASNHKFVVWSSLLNQRSTQQEISVGRRRRPADACGPLHGGLGPADLQCAGQCASRPIGT
jgi:hypothetical protein